MIFVFFFHEAKKIVRYAWCGTLFIMDTLSFANLSKSSNTKRVFYFKILL